MKAVIFEFDRMYVCGNRSRAVLSTLMTNYENDHFFIMLTVNLFLGNELRNIKLYLSFMITCVFYNKIVYLAE